MDDRRSLLKRIKELSFAKDETILFLDTNPHNKMALDYLKDLIKKLDTGIEEYQNKYGPIYHEGAISDQWEWAHGAWPWQNEIKEGQE